MMSWLEVIATIEEAIEEGKIDGFEDFNMKDFEAILNKED